MKIKIRYHTYPEVSCSVEQNAVLHVSYREDSNSTTTPPIGVIFVAKSFTIVPVTMTNTNCPQPDASCEQGGRTDTFIDENAFVA